VNNGIYGFGRTLVSSLPYGFNNTTQAVSVRVLVVGAGGGGSNGNASSAQASGGGGGVIDDTINVTLGTNYLVSIGAGSPTHQSGPIGNTSRFNSLFAIGGGQWNVGNSTTARGATGSGSVISTAPQVAFSGQGFNGGTPSGNTRSGGGGGAGGVGANATTTSGGNGGVGRSSTVPVVASLYGGGGGGGVTNTAGHIRGLGAKDPVIGGGGNGGDGTNIATDGDANTGGGGGGGGQSATASIAAGGAGGSGVVIIRYPNYLQINIGVGLTFSSQTTGSDIVVTFTGGSDNISFN
jgi:hypothetical protein